jgi:ribosomal protein S18 acetylase RimI-like enzyme
MPVKIRPMTAADKPALMQILARTPEFKSFEVKVAEEVIDAYLDDAAGSGYNILVAVDGVRLAGYICYGPTPCTDGTWDMYWEAVDPAQRGRGIGTALTEAAEAAMTRAGGRMIMIETSASPLYDNTRRFHQSRGYVTVASVPDFYAPADDMLIMQKRLK